MQLAAGISITLQTIVRLLGTTLKIAINIKFNFKIYLEFVLIMRLLFWMRLEKLHWSKHFPRFNGLANAVTYLVQYQICTNFYQMWVNLT